MRLVVDNGRHGPTYIDVPAFDSQAYVCAEYLHKGSKVGVSGRLAHREWRAADGSKRERYSVIGWVEFLDRPSSAEAERASKARGGRAPAHPCWVAVQRPKPVVHALGRFVVDLPGR